MELKHIIITIILSIAIIGLVHKIILFLIDKLTRPKTKDMIHIPAMQYDKILNTMPSTTNTNYVDNTVVEDTSINSEMKNELLQYITTIKTVVC